MKITELKTAKGSVTWQAFKMSFSAIFSLWLGYAAWRENHYVFGGVFLMMGVTLLIFGVWSVIAFKPEIIARFDSDGLHYLRLKKDFFIPWYAIDDVSVGTVGREHVALTINPDSYFYQTLSPYQKLVSELDRPLTFGKRVIRLDFNTIKGGNYTAVSLIKYYLQNYEPIHVEII